jgi:hypothetical protein
MCVSDVGSDEKAEIIRILNNGNARISRSSKRGNAQKDFAPRRTSPGEDRVCSSPDPVYDDAFHSKFI